MDAAAGEIVLRRLPEVVWKPKSESRSSSGASACSAFLQSEAGTTSENGGNDDDNGDGNHEDKARANDATLARRLLPWLALLIHAGRTSAGAFASAAIFNGGLALLLKVIAALKRRKVESPTAYAKAVLGRDNLRFSLMIALWSLLYRATHDSLQLARHLSAAAAAAAAAHSQWQQTTRRSSIEMHLTPAISDVGSSRGSSVSSSTSASATTTPETSPATTTIELPEEDEDNNDSKNNTPAEKQWYDGYLAGALSGLALLVETRANRTSMAQQVMVRGLQGSLSRFKIPHASVLAFGLACGQIMYASLNRPETLPSGYVAWVRTALHASPISLDIHGAVRRSEPIDTERVAKKLLNSKATVVTEQNARAIKEWLLVANNKGRNTIPCAVSHPWSHSHWRELPRRFLVVTRWVWPVYLTLTMLPAVTLHFKSLMKAPIRGLLMALFASVRSSAFLGAFVLIHETLHCLQNIWGLPVSTKFDWLIGFATCLSLFVDNARRRAELAVYVLPKGAQSAWMVARQKRWVPHVPAGEVLLGSAGLSLVMGTYTNRPEQLAGVVRRIVSRLLE